MSAAKHTPGPWRYCPNTYAKSRHVSHLEIYATEPVATVFAHLLAAEANARLIAAAPDLLAALSDCLAFWDAPPTGYDCPTSRRQKLEAIQRCARAAIAKANTATQ